MQRDGANRSFIFECDAFNMEQHRPSLFARSDCAMYLSTLDRLTFNPSRLTK